MRGGLLEKLQVGRRAKTSPSQSSLWSSLRTAQFEPTRRKERPMRQQFVHELTTALPIHPVTIPVALRAGQIDGENAARGIRLAISDLLIGVTALDLGYRVATANLRHFRMVPGLEVIAF